MSEEQNVVSLREIIGGGYDWFFKSKHEYIALKGGRGSKKSKTAAIRWIYLLLKYPEANLLVVRKTFATLKDSCYSDLLWAMERLKVSHLFNATKNPLEITLKHTNQKILFRGMDEASKITSISVPKGVLCWCWFEEFFELQDEIAFNKLDYSIRGQLPEGYFRQIVMTMNPWSDRHFSKARFFDVKDDPTILSMTTNYMCNEFLSPEDVARFERMKKTSPRRYAVEGLGEWGRISGLVFENVVQEEFSIPELRKRDGLVGAFGVDFGWVDETAFICSLIDEEEGKIYVFDEFYKSNTTLEQLAQVIIDKGFARQQIVCDAAEPRSIARLNELGVKAVAGRKGKDSVMYGIRLLQEYQIVVHPRCTYAWRDLSNYSWAMKDNQPLDKPDHAFSHACDALRYSIVRSIVGSHYSFD